MRDRIAKKITCSQSIWGNLQVKFYKQDVRKISSHSPVRRSFLHVEICEYAFDDLCALLLSLTEERGICCASMT